ncbi:MAG TPA: glycoside hydrolase family 15 protein [Candidatus Paceibacterota bacterium]|nr:glycoside hydrolase family 15 protein [Candidatus Paceibacterota bacterium]
MLVCLDEFAQVRDFYYPYVGQEDHLGRDLVHRVGVWVDGKISWLSDGTWNISVKYANETMASDITCSNDGLGVELHFLDVVYNETNIFLRQVRIRNTRAAARHAKVFFNQEFRISENEHADTAYYNPTVEALIHYKGRRVFLVGGTIDGRPFDEYSVGLLGIEGKEGTWKDAEDGVLSKNPIEHGAVDSVAGFSMALEPLASAEFSYWVCAGQTYREVQALQKYIIAKTPAHLLETTQDFWHAWVNKISFTFQDLAQETKRLFKVSLLVIRAHCDNRGGILASGDSGNFQQYGRDTYSYVWPRDGAFTALSLDKAGYTDIAERFFSFCNDLVTDEGYLMHKYQPDKSLGSSWHPWVKDGKAQLAIQEDETATLIFAFWEHYRDMRDLEFVEKIYNNFVKLCAEFMLSFREPQTGLPAASYDLWEEKWGVSAYTAASVYGALAAAANFANLLGKEEEKLRYAREAERIRNLIIEYFLDKDTGGWRKLLNIVDGKAVYDTTIDASSFYGAFRFGVLPAADPRMITSHKVLKDKLSSGEPFYGLGRYVGDKYFAAPENELGNPWFVTTLWSVEYRINLALTRDDLQALAAELNRIAGFATSSGILSEQIDPATGKQLSISPLVWSHSAFVSAVIAYMERAETLGLGKAVSDAS